MESQFRVVIEPYRFKLVTFQQAAEHNANLINYCYIGHLALGLSGGADSEYIARLFHSMKIPFTPIIVHFPGNENDAEFAFSLCDELKVTPIEVLVSEDQIFKYYTDNIYGQWRNDGLNHTFQMMVVEKAKELDMVAVLGESHIFDPDPTKSIVGSFKFLPDFIYTWVVPFYYHTLELTYAEMIETKEGESAQEFKARVRGTKLREKSYPVYTWDTFTAYQNFKQTLNLHTLYHDMGTPQDFIKQMESYII